MTSRAWNYPPELMDALTRFGLAPTPGTPPRVVRDALNDLYRFEIRRLRDQLLAHVVAKPDYLGHVIALRKKIWPLSLTVDAWEKICGGEEPH